MLKWLGASLREPNAQARDPGVLEAKPPATPTIKSSQKTVSNRLIQVFVSGETSRKCVNPHQNDDRSLIDIVSKTAPSY